MFLGLCDWACMVVSHDTHACSMGALEGQITKTGKGQRIS